MYLRTLGWAANTTDWPQAAKAPSIAFRFILSSVLAGLCTVALRPHLIFGPGDPHLLPRLVARARAGKLAVVGSRDNLVPPT